MSRNRFGLVLLGLLLAAEFPVASLAAHRADGYHEVRSAHGGLLEYRFFLNGKKEGEHLGWWPDGKPRFLYHFKAGKYDGAQTTWGPRGTMATLNHYRMGREEGLQRAWTGDGVMTFNYTVRDGRIYGYRGTRECGR